ncbi:MAG: cobalamin-dependent protein, partial [Thiomonas sp.]|nr:cobalamin-dependent protein [Thiomonas sp.]
MTDLSDAKILAAYRPQQRLRFVTAAALFDGHDAAINIMRRILIGMGAEVIHLGHNRSVDEIVTAAIQEDAHAIAISSYQGGHVEFFRYMIDRLRAEGAGHIQVFGGGGGVIVATEIAALQAYGVARIYSPEDGQALGLQGMIGDMLRRADKPLPARDGKHALDALQPDAQRRARVITQLEGGAADAALLHELHARAEAAHGVVLGVTGTGGAGKSSLVDELIRRV